MSLKQLVLGVFLGASLVSSAIANDYLNTTTEFVERQSDADTVIILVPEGAELALNGLAESTRAMLARAAEVEDFTGKSGSMLNVIAPVDHAAERVFLVGVGNVSELPMHEAETIGANIAAQLANVKAKTVAVNASLIDNPGRSSDIAAAMAHGVDLRNYRFDMYKSEPSARPEHSYQWVVNSSRAAERQYEQLQAIANGVFFARDIIALPGGDGYPAAIAERAREALEPLGIEVTILDTEAVKEAGMGALYGVSKGSQHGAYLVAAHYKGSNEQPIALVGKGNTFDTGGYNLKTSSGSILRMQTDKAGAAAVLGAVMALAAQKADVNVVAVAPLSHNLISGSALLPGDVVTTGDGTKVEVANTDAEGRLILADGIWYARDKFNPRAMADIATLTGAKVGALGTDYSAAFGVHQDLMDAMKTAGELTQERVWELPIEGYSNVVSSRLADIKNVGSPGAQAGALFLQHFVGDTPWVHIDMAGNAMVDSPQGIHPAGPTGYGVRLLTEWVKQVD